MDAESIFAVGLVVGLALGLAIAAVLSWLLWPQAVEAWLDENGRG